MMILRSVKLTETLHAGPARTETGGLTAVSL